VTLEVTRTIRGLKVELLRNMLLKFVTLDVFRPMGWSKAEWLRNRLLMFVTVAVFPQKSWLNAEWPMNMLFVFVTLDVSQQAQLPRERLESGRTTESSTPKHDRPHARHTHSVSN
jgi:hypothetical protein